MTAKETILNMCKECQLDAMTAKDPALLIGAIHAAFKAGDIARANKLCIIRDLLREVDTLAPEYGTRWACLGADSN